MRSLVAVAAICLICAAQSAMAQDVPQPAQAPPQAAPAKGAKAAAKGKSATPAEKADPASAERALESSIKYYESGKFDTAVQAINMVLQSGGLPSVKMARALYFRGLSYKKLGKPAQAISDLTSALWLKGGLAPSERTEALAQRASAYREAGLGEPPAIEQGGTKAATATLPASAHTASAPPPAAAAPSAPPVSTPAPAAVAAPAAPASGPVLAAAPTATATPEAPEASSGGIGGFFTGLFGGGAATPAPQGVAAPAATGSITPPPAPTPAVSSWSGTTKVSSGSAPTKVATAAPASAAPVAEAGKWRLQVAAVRTKAEAEAIAAKVKREFGKKLANREAMIDSANIGDMGTFYRVRVGPYANANEPRQLCTSMRAAGGYDCLVVTQ